MSIILTIDGDSRALKTLGFLNSSFDFEHIKLRLHESSSGDSSFQKRTQEPQDSRKSLKAFEFTPFVLSLAIPATYVIKKLIDPILAEIGKSLATVVKKCFKSNSRISGISNQIALKVIVDTERYIVVMGEATPKPAEMQRVIEAIKNHWEEGKTQSKAENTNVYEVLLVNEAVEIRMLDPFLTKK